MTDSDIEADKTEMTIVSNGSNNEEDVPFNAFGHDDIRPVTPPPVRGMVSHDIILNALK